MADIADLLLDTGGGVATTGIANAYLLNLPTAPTAYADNLLFVCKFHASCTGPSTININGLGIKDIKKLQEGVPAPLVQGDAPAGHRAVCIYSSADNAVLMLLAAPTFTQNGSGAISWPITERMKEQVYLLDFIPQSEHAAIRAGTSTYDASSAMANCIASLTVTKFSVGVGGPEIILPYGKTRFNSPIQINKTMHLKGHGVGGAGGPATILEFAAGSHGIIIHTGSTWGLDGGAPAWRTFAPFIVGDFCWRSLTSSTNIYECIVAGPGNCSVPPSHSSGDVAGADGYTWRLHIFDNLSGSASTLRDFLISSLGTKGVHAGHGLWPRGKVDAENVSIYSFPENGIHMWADVHSQGEVQGNANTSRFSRMRTSSCGKHGVYINGGDVNACLFEGIDSSSNGGCGVWDGSFLGNTHVMTHTAANGLSAQVSYLGNRYYVGNEDLASTTAPGTDASWILIGAGGADASYPNWVSGTPYIYGNSFRTDNLNDICGVILGLYIESGQPLQHITAGWILVSPRAIGGTGGGFRIATDSTTGTGRLSPFKVDALSTSATAFTTNYSTAANQAVAWLATGDASAGLAFNLHATDKSWCYQWNNQTPSLRFTNNLSTTLVGGRSTAIPGSNIILQNGMFLGNPYRFVSMAASIPTTGEHAAGELVFNCLPSAAASPLGWRCVTSGTPGTWQAIYVSSSPSTFP